MRVCAPSDTEIEEGPERQDGESGPPTSCGVRAFVESRRGSKTSEIAPTSSRARFSSGGCGNHVVSTCARPHTPKGASLSYSPWKGRVRAIGCSSIGLIAFPHHHPRHLHSAPDIMAAAKGKSLGSGLPDDTKEIVCSPAGLGMSSQSHSPMNLAPLLRPHASVTSLSPT